MGLDCTFVNPNSKIDKDGTDEAYNYSSYDTIGNGNLRMIASFPFAQYSGCAGFGETIRGLHGSTVAELNEWLSNLKTWILDNIGEQFGNYRVGMFDANVVDAFIEEISCVSTSYIVCLW